MFFNSCRPRSSNPELDLVGDVVVDRPGDKNAAGFGQRLEPRCDIDAVAQNIAALGDHVAEIDADAHRDALFVGQVLVMLHHRLAQGGGGAHRLDNAAKLAQH
jgi:hypothetical protein